MCLASVVIFDVGLHDSALVHFAKYDAMVEALPTDRADEAFCIAIFATVTEARLVYRVCP